MRMRALAFVAACALAACNPSAPSGQSADNAGGNANGGMPTSNVSYRADMTMSRPDGGTMPALMYRSGAKTRTEVDAPTGRTIMIMDNSTHEGLMVMSMGGTTIGRRIDGSTPGNPGAEAFDPTTVVPAERTGTCNVAGESGAEYTRTTDAGPIVGCVTSDGIMLRTSMNGRTIMEATHIQRGAQDAALFADPPGVTIVEGNDMSAIAAAVARAQAGH